MAGVFHILLLNQVALMMVLLVGRNHAQSGVHVLSRGHWCWLGVPALFWKVGIEGCGSFSSSDDESVGWAWCYRAALRADVIRAGGLALLGAGGGGLCFGCGFLGNREGFGWWGRGFRL